MTADPIRDADELLEAAWGVIANAGGWQDPNVATPGWRNAAERWRDDYHALLAALAPVADLPPGVHTMNDGSGVMWLTGAQCPPGWEWQGASGLWHPAESFIESTKIAHRVRPKPAPAVETIDTRLAKGRKLADGRVLVRVGDGDYGRWWQTEDDLGVTYVPEVVVLVDGGES